MGHPAHHHRFTGDAAPDPVRVRFSPRVSRWARERYPDCQEQADGADAEVVEPEAYREAVRRAVA